VIKIKGTAMFGNHVDAGVRGYIEITDVTDPLNHIKLVSKSNAINYENFSFALAKSISNSGEGFISEMVFGNGGSRVDPTGIITYLTPNVSSTGAALYNQTYSKVVDSRSSSSKDPTRNFMEVRHILGTTYSDVLVTCLLDFGEPSDQSAFDNSTNQDGKYVFDELGLKSGGSNPLLLTHVIFHPQQKSLNRLIQIDYTVRIQSLTLGI
jgi:hypothetical protein